MQNKSIFIAAARELSFLRIKEVLSRIPTDYKISIGCYTENYISGLEGSTHFKTMKFTKKELKYLTALNVNVINYSYSELSKVLENLKPDNSLFFNGSWQFAFNKTEFYRTTIEPLGFKYKLISPFRNNAEAINYCNIKKIEQQKLVKIDLSKEYREADLILMLDKIKTFSWDWNFQVAAIAVKNKKIVAYGFNSVLPYESYSAHFGSRREKHLSGSGDLNNQDTLHAEISMLINALENKCDLKDAVVYLNLMPCNNCAMALAKSPIAKIVYTNLYSDGKSIEVLCDSGKEVAFLKIN